MTQLTSTIEFEQRKAQERDNIVDALNIPDEVRNALRWAILESSYATYELGQRHGGLLVTDTPPDSGA
jgi:hypothetical protein